MADDTTKASRPKGGRNKLAPEQARSHRVQLYLTPEEHKQLLLDFKQSGSQSMSAYVAKRLFDKDCSTINPIIFLEQMDNIGRDINHIGNHINQIARYANSLTLQENTDPEVLHQFHQHMEVYHRVRQKLVAAYRNMIKKFE